MDTPYSVTVVDEVPSTQDLARREAGDGRPAVAIAHRQTEGRGRSGSDWRSAPRSVAVSVAFRPRWEPSLWPRIPLVAGVAARRVLGPIVGLKWPNDVLVAGAKVGGILVEASADGVVAGMGINLFWPDPPPGVGALCPADPGREKGPGLGRAWAGELLDLVDLAPEDWPRREYVDACVTLGQDIVWEPDGVGLARDVADDGSLVVETPGGRIVSLTSGAVRHVRSRPDPTSD